MERRKFVIGAGALASGGAAAVGTGAFSFVRADRDVTIDVVADEAAYLGLEATSAYASGTSEGTLELNWAGAEGQNGEGLNDDASSRFDDVFTIKNQGTNDARISFHDTEGEVGYDSPAATWYYQKEGQDKQFSEDRQLHDTRGIDLPVLEPGESMSIHVIFWLSDYDQTDLPDNLGIVAEEP